MLFDAYDNALARSDALLVNPSGEDVKFLQNITMVCECPLIETLTDGFPCSVWCCHHCPEAGPSMQLLAIRSDVRLCPYTSWAYLNLPKLTGLQFDYTSSSKATTPRPTPTFRTTEASDFEIDTLFYRPYCGDFLPRSPRYEEYGPLRDFDHLLKLKTDFSMSTTEEEVKDLSITPKQETVT